MTTLLTNSQHLPTTDHRNQYGDTQHDAPYAQAIAQEGKRGLTRLFVPGHLGESDANPGMAQKLGHQVFELDLPMLLSGVDLDAGPGAPADAPTPMQRSLQLAAEAWGAARTWFLTNGASMGNQVTCLALRNFGRKVLVQKSVHSSVIDGMVLAGLEPVFLHPTIDHAMGAAHGVTTDQVRQALVEHPDVSAVYVVSPSYFGAVADVPGIVQAGHAAGVAVVVDEAWAPHFGFSPHVPENALRHGADVVISSTHKFMGSLTQSAMLHLGTGPMAQQLEPQIARVYNSLQSTSSSSLLMLSLDEARRHLAVHGDELIGRAVTNADAIRAAVTAHGRFRDESATIMAAPDVVALDPLKIVINTEIGGLNGHQARTLMWQEHGVAVEMSTATTITGLLGAAGYADVPTFMAALTALPEQRDGERLQLALPAPAERALSLRQAYFTESEVVPAAEAVGRISASSLAAYPPGIPNIMPGEVFTPEIVDFLQRTAASPGGYVRGGVESNMQHFRVIQTQN